MRRAVRILVGLCLLTCACSKSSGSRGESIPPVAPAELTTPPAAQGEADELDGFGEGEFVDEGGFDGGGFGDTPQNEATPPTSEPPAAEPPAVEPEATPTPAPTDAPEPEPEPSGEDGT